MSSKTFTLTYVDPNDPTQDVTIVVTATQNGANVDFVAEVTEGEADLKALFIDCGPDEGGDLGAGGPRSWGVPNYANMQGTGETFDEVFTPDELVPGYSGVTEITGTIANKTLDDVLAVGVRAMSTGDDREGSLKLTSDTPDGPIDVPDDFPEWLQDISNVVLYWDADDVAAGADTKPNQQFGGPDGFYTVKIDSVPDAASNDLDDWIEEALAWLVVNDDNIDADAAEKLLGAAIKGGVQTTQFYAYGDNNTNGTDPDPFPGGSEIANNAIDQSFNYEDVIA